MKYREWRREMDRAGDEADVALDRLGADNRRRRWSRWQEDPEGRAELEADARAKMDRVNKLWEQQPQQPLGSMVADGIADWFAWSDSALVLLMVLSGLWMLAPLALALIGVSMFWIIASIPIGAIIIFTMMKLMD